MKIFKLGSKPKKLNSLISEASLAQKNQNWAKARNIWEIVIQIDPENVNAWLQLGNMSNELGLYKQAISDFEKAKSLEKPAPILSLEGMAGVYERDGRWKDALNIWEKLIDTLSFYHFPSKSEHAHMHAALCAIEDGNENHAIRLLEQIEEVSPGTVQKSEFQILSIRTLKSGNLEYITNLIKNEKDSIQKNPDICYKISSILLNTEYLLEASDVIEIALKTKYNDTSFLWLAADIYDRLNEWDKVLSLSLKMMDIDSNNSKFYKRAFHASVKTNSISISRKIAIAALRNNDYNLAHELITVYKNEGELNKARLICRWISKVWPHSQWHKLEYIRLVCQTSSIDCGDKIIRNEILNNGSNEDLDRCYVDSAFQSGNYMESVRRIKFFLKKYKSDIGMNILLGYAIANSIGIDDAEAHFSEVATETYQSRDALVGLAHMAMRRRDKKSTFERWLRVVNLYNDYDIGYVELARSAYEMRDLQFVDDLCNNRLSNFPNDRTMGEFYCWYLTATGKFDAAWSHIMLLAKKEKNWTIVELGVQASIKLNKITENLNIILSWLPKDTTVSSSKRLYQIIRDLISANRPDLIRYFVENSFFDYKLMPWLFPYIDGKSINNVKNNDYSDFGKLSLSKDRWSLIKSYVRYDISEYVNFSDDEKVSKILMNSKESNKTIHIINKFEQISGGSELHALDIADRVSEYASVQLWAPEMPHPFFYEQKNVRPIEAASGKVPYKGVLVFIGVYFDIKYWISNSRPSRVIILYNTFESPMLFEKIDFIFKACGVMPEILFCSNMMQEEVKLPGLFEPSPTDIDSFVPRKNPFEVDHRFTLGRHSRDVMEKHSPEDWKIYEEVSKLGGFSKILGGTCMSATFPNIPGMELLPAKSGNMVPFLQSLDCYFYRTSTWVEPWGRVVIEAMACGLPVVVCSNGGYAQVIKHGENGFLFETTEQAVEIIRSLIQNPLLRKKIGNNARKTAEDLLGADAMKKLVSFYLA